MLRNVGVLSRQTLQRILHQSFLSRFLDDQHGVSSGCSADEVDVMCRDVVILDLLGLNLIVDELLDLFDIHVL